MAALEAAIQSQLRPIEGARLDGRVKPGHDKKWIYPRCSPFLFDLGPIP